MEIGICTFADMASDSGTGRGENGHQRLRNLMEEIALADELGLDVFAVGEHHRPDYAVSAPTVVLAAAAETNQKHQTIQWRYGVKFRRSGAGVSVSLQRWIYSRADAPKSWRAVVLLLNRFRFLVTTLATMMNCLSEKLAMLVELNKGEKLTWQGKHTQTIKTVGIYPRPYNSNMPIWVAVGGTPESRWCARRNMVCP